MADEIPDPVGQSEKRKAQAEADRAEAELAEWKSASARLAREAERRAAAGASVRGRVPDFSDVDRGSLTTPDSGTLFGSVLGLHALRSAAVTVVEQVVAHAVPEQPKRSDQTDATHQAGQAGSPDNHFVVSTDAELASSDCAYLDVLHGLDVLFAAARDCLDPPPPAPPANQRLSPTADAAASLLPALISLTSSRRLLATQTLTNDTGAAAAAVAGAIADSGRSVWHDDVRVMSTLDPSPLRNRLDELQARRRDLVTNGSGEALAVVARIDELVVALAAIPAAGTRSLLVSALLRERLHVAPDGVTVWLVWVQGITGSASQVVDDRPFVFKDRVSTVASCGITYLLVEASTGRVRGGGTVVETCSMSGKIGSEFELGPVQDSRRPTSTDVRAGTKPQHAATSGLALAAPVVTDAPRRRWRRRGSR